MPTTINTTDLHPVLKRATYTAAHLCLRHRLPWFDAEDARQELLLDLLSRVRHHDPNRGSLGSFAEICFHHRGRRLGFVLRRERHQRHPKSLDAAVPGAEHLTVVDTLTNEDGIGFWVGQDADPVAQSELHHDLDRALSGMGPDTVPLCAALLGHEHDDKAPGSSRSTRHRRVRDLRCRLLVAGVGHRGTNRPVGEY